MSAPQSIEWSKLSPAAIETARQIGFRMTAGYSLGEIAAQLEDERGSLKHLQLPPGPVKAGWIQARLRDLRDEVEKSGAASF